MTKHDLAWGLGDLVIYALLFFTLISLGPLWAGMLTLFFVLAYIFAPQPIPEKAIFVSVFLIALLSLFFGLFKYRFITALDLSVLCFSAIILTVIQSLSSLRIKKNNHDDNEKD